MGNLKLEGVLKEIERRIENELGMDEGELVKSLDLKDRDYVDDLINYYGIEALKSGRRRGVSINADTIRWLIRTILMFRTMGIEKQPRPEDPFQKYDYDKGEYFTPVPKDQ